MTDVSIADESFEAGDIEFEGHRGGGGLGGVGDGDNDRIVIDGDGFESGQFFAECFAGHVDASVVECTGDVGEVDPFEEAVRAFG